MVSFLTIPLPSTSLRHQALRAIRHLFNSFSEPFYRRPEATVKVDSIIPAISLLLFILILFFVSPFFVRPSIFAGDEPHYLLVANSMRLDGDLELKEDYAKVLAGEARAGKSFAGAYLDHHTYYVDRTTARPNLIGPANGRDKPKQEIPPSERTVRALGWPACIAVVSFVIPFVEPEILAKCLSHFFVLAAALLMGIIARKSGASLAASAMASAAVAIGSSYWIYANTAFSEPLLGFCLACAIYSIETRSRPILFASALIVGIWTKFQYIPTASVLLFLGYFRLGRREFHIAAVLFAIGAFSLGVFNLSQYGTLRPPMQWENGVPLDALGYFFTNSKTSILMRNPWLIIVCVAPVIAILPGLPRPTIGWWLLVASILILPSLWRYYDGGYCYPGRLILPLILPAALYFAHILECRSFAIRLLCFALLSASILQTTVAAFTSPFITWSLVVGNAPPKALLEELPDIN